MDRRRIWSNRGRDQKIEVGILINNVGITYPRAIFFHEVDQNTWTKIIRVNLEAMTWVARSLISPMLHRRRGDIVNISSGAAVVVPSHPLYAIYGATKAYVEALSRSLHVEYKQFGIDVQCQVPLYVATRMGSEVAAIDKPSFFVPSPEVYAKPAVKKIGIGSRCSPFGLIPFSGFFAGFCRITSSILGVSLSGFVEDLYLNLWPTGPGETIDML